MTEASSAHSHFQHGEGGTEAWQTPVNRTHVTGSQHGAEQQQLKTASLHVLILVLTRRFFSLLCDCEASCLFRLCWGAFMGIKLCNFKWSPQTRVGKMPCCVGCEADREETLGQPCTQRLTHPRGPELPTPTCVLLRL